MVDTKRAVRGKSAKKSKKEKKEKKREKRSDDERAKKIVKCETVAADEYEETFPFTFKRDRSEHG